MGEAESRGESYPSEDYRLTAAVKIAQLRDRAAMPTARRPVRVLVGDLLGWDGGQQPPKVVGVDRVCRRNDHDHNRDREKREGNKNRVARFFERQRDGTAVRCVETVMGNPRTLLLNRESQPSHEPITANNQMPV